MIQGNIGRGSQAHPVLFAALQRHGFQTAADFGEGFHHAMEVLGVDANQLHVIERRARGRAGTAAQKPDFPEIIAARKIGQH